MKLDMTASAVLVWLPEGEKATTDNLDISNVQTPPNPNPEPWWYLEDAIVHAREVQHDHGKVPWIKTGDTLLSPDQIVQAYSGIRAMRAHDA